MSDTDNVVVTQSGNDGSVLSMFAVLAAVGAFVIAVISVIVVSTKAGGGGGEAAAAAPVAVTATEFKFTPGDLAVQQGGSLAITNGGSQVHNLEVKDGPKTADIAAGGTANLDLAALAVGSYEYFCNIPGHADSGMKGTLTISEGAPSGGSAAADTGSGVSDDAASHGGIDYQASDEVMTANLDAYLAANTGKTEPLTEGVGNEVLAPTTVEADGTMVFDLEAKIADWEVSPGKTVQAWTFNGMVPAPWIKVPYNTKVRFNFKNSLPSSSDIHWHGLDTPNDQDGVAPLTQEYVQPGETYVYEFTTTDRPQLGMYHPHNHGQIAIPNGMMGIFQVGDVPLPQAGNVGGFEIPADITVSQEIPMVLNDAGVIGLTLNGKSYPATAAVVQNVDTWTAMHYLNEGLLSHPMHLHGMPQLIVAKDGIPLDQPYWADTINVAPGERYTVLVHPTIENVGAWAFHCHILNHAENDDGLFGMVTAWVVPDPNAPAA